MARLIAAGCSYTYGHGLEDCFNPPLDPGPNPSKYAWPSLVAKDVNKEAINLSKPGGSNKEIVYYLDNFDFKEDDICLIQWTFLNRYTVIYKDGNIERIGPWSKSKIGKAYQSIASINIYDDVVNFRFLFNYINYKLKDKRVKVINFTPFISTKRFKDENEVFLDLCNFDFNFDKESMGTWPQRDKALDNMHPGPITHKEFANYVLGEYPWLND